MNKIRIYKVDGSNVYEEFTIQQTFNYKDRMNEQLDECLIAINLIEKQDFQSYDRAIILQDNSATLLYWYLGNIEADSATFKDNEPYLFNYTIQLLSPTKYLERIILPNIAITQPLTGARKTILNQINRIKNLYAPNFNIGSDIINATQNVECPEMVMQNSTLKEVLNVLLEPVHRIVRVVGWTLIRSIDLNAKGNPIDTSKIVDHHYSMLEGDYTNFLYSSLTNGLIAKKPHILATVREYNLSARANNNILTTETMQLILAKPIYKIKKVIAKLKAQYLDEDNDRTNTYIEVDITARVLEKKEYDLINSLDQRFYLYFNRESNIIDGLSYHIASSNATYGIYGSIYQSLKDQGLLVDDDHRTGYLLASIYDNDRNPMTEVMYDVEYEALDDITLVTHKDVSARHNVGLIDKQNDSYIDTDRFGLREKDAVNRLGNEQLLMLYRCSSINELPELGDYYRDFKVVEEDVTVSEGEVIAKLYLYKNYVMKNLFTGISSKRRSWQYAAANEACLRQENIHYFVKVGKVADSNTDLIKYFTDFIYPSGNDYLVRALTLKTTSIEPNFTSTEIIIPFSTRLCGDSVTFNFTLMDNITVGSQNKGHSNEFAIFSSGGWNQQYIKYVDSLGEFYQMVLQFYGGVIDVSSVGINNISGSNNAFSRKVSWRLPEYREDSNEVLNYNLLNSPLDITISKTMYKDNREILGVTVQFEYKSNDIETFIIGSGLADVCSLICTALPLTLSIYVNDDYFEPPIYDEVVGTKILTAITFQRTSLGINISFADQANYKSYILCATINGVVEPLIYVNQRNNQAVTFIPFAVEQ